MRAQVRLSPGPIRVLSPHPCFIPPPMFYPPIRVYHPSVSVPSVWKSKMAAQPVKNHRQCIGKTMFFAFYVRLLFPIPLNHLFLGRTNWCESFGCISVLISTIYNIKFNRARMGKTKGARNCQPGFFACVFLQSFTIFSQVMWYIYNYSKSHYCLFCSFIAISTKIQYFHLKILGHSILKNRFFYRSKRMPWISAWIVCCKARRGDLKYGIRLSFHK
jgi:hypothetical protein